jgi:NAD(P)-dependent dehydrogenase (short-subunit alcohol dehydrogenase family)
MSLDGLRIWLTGASTGIGAALVDPLIRRGARVAITARRSDLLDAIVTAHARGAPSPILAVPADVTDRDAVTAAARRIEAAWGGIDLAIFNAGGSVAADPQSAIRNPQFRADDYTATMTLNYFSVVYGIDAVLPGMLARGSGHIAAVASLAGYRPIPVTGAYGTSKAAVIYLLDSLRFDLEPRGVRVTVINPGFVRTPLTARNAFKMPFLVEAGDAAERIVRGLERGKMEIHFPAPLSWTMKLMRILPYPWYVQVIRRLSPR